MIELNCKELSEKILDDVKTKVEEYVSEGKRRPTLSVIQVGNNPASTTYVRKKKEACEKVGIINDQINLPEETTEEELLKVIDDLNENETIDGILVQLPLPSHIHEDTIIGRISPKKDVDGFSPINVGNMILGEDCFIPCTPKGILEVINYFNIPTSGKNVVVFGRSNIVGRPIANLLSQREYNSTVTICHTKTNGVYYEDIVGCADIIILAVGKPNFFNKELLRYVKKNATIIDVGINRIPDPSKKSGFRLCGDFDYKTNVEDWNSDDRILQEFNVWFDDAKYTPVPGGIGLMTVSCLLENTLKSYENRISL